MPAATDGTDVIKLQHTKGQDGHHNGDPQYCTACGEGIAQCLTEKLHVGQPGRGKKFTITFLQLCGLLRRVQPGCKIKKKRPFCLPQLDSMGQLFAALK
jgi:hypothetical protein